MATTTADIRQGAGLSGGVSYAPLGTTLPTDSTTALIGAYKDLGGISDAGIVRTPTISTNDIRLRDGSLGRRVITTSETTFAFTMVETQANTFKVFFPSSTTTTSTGATTQTIKPPATQILVYVFDVLDGAVHRRIVVPRAEVTSWDPINYTTGAITYGVTISAYTDTSGNVAYEYTDDPAFP